MDFTSAEIAHALDRFFAAHCEDAIVLLGPDGRAAELNDAARALPIDARALFEHGLPEVRELRQRLARGERATAMITFSEPGSLRAIELRGWPLGEGALVVLRDRTAQRALEEELRHLRRVEAIGMVSAALAHDLNNLLGVVLVATTALRAGATGEHAELVQHIQDAAERASALVHDMLGVARVRTATAEEVDVGAVVTELRPLLSRVLGSDIELTTSVARALGRTAVDRARLEHALVNLVVNARDAMPDGGRVAISVARVGASVSLRVADEGIGMTQEVRDRVFERFYTTKASGTGIGLASVHGFVRESAGTISVESEPGAGTVVEIRLPCAASDDL